MSPKRKANDKRISQLIRACEDQGLDVQDAPDGYKVKNTSRKDVPPVVVHTTYSDHRSFLNVVSRLRRHGLVWPPPKKEKG